MKKILFIGLSIGLLAAGCNKDTPEQVTQSPQESDQNQRTTTEVQRYQDSAELFNFEYPQSWHAQDLTNTGSLRTERSVGLKLNQSDNNYLATVHLIKSTDDPETWYKKMNLDIQEQNKSTINNKPVFYAKQENPSYTDNNWVMDGGDYLAYVSFRERSVHLDPNTGAPDDIDDHTQYKEQVESIVRSIEFK